jgi:hypothetical protein
MNTVSEPDKNDRETPMLVILKGYHLSLREHVSAAIDDNQRVSEKYNKQYTLSFRQSLREHASTANG